MDFDRKEPGKAEPTEARMPFGKYKGCTVAEIPSSYLDWLLGQDWFVEQSRNWKLVTMFVGEIATRKRSGWEPPVTEEERLEWAKR